MDPTRLFVQCSGDGCCGASTSERKRQALCACWTNQSLPSRLFQHRHVSQASTSFRTSLLHLLHWIALIRNISTHAYMAILTRSGFSTACRTSCGGKVERWRPSRADDDNRKAVNTVTIPRRVKVLLPSLLSLLSLLPGPFMCCDGRFSNN
jgi:hypothetical protein